MGNLKKWHRFRSCLDFVVLIALKRWVPLMKGDRVKTRMRTTDCVHSNGVIIQRQRRDVPVRGCQPTKMYILKGRRI